MLEIEAIKTSVFESLESNVRSYCRSFPTQFSYAKGALLQDEHKREYIDFLMGAGALNYGHNNDYIKEQVIKYISNDGIIQGLDMYTNAKEAFIQQMNDTMLKPKELKYKFMFCGPTGTNAVEAALKLARNYTKRTRVFAFMGGYHGMTLGGLSVTSNASHRNASGVELNNVTFIPYEDGYINNFDALDYMESLLKDTHSGISKPAAVIVETVQAEGGVYVASEAWLVRLREICNKHGILLICDDIQVGCGRTGTFFSFERATIQPDIVVLSKSLSGYGFPMSMLLLKPELDIWKPAEHNGTFRGFQLAFVGAKAALEYYQNFNLEQTMVAKSKVIEHVLKNEIAAMHPDIRIRGIGMIWGIDFAKFQESDITGKITQRCFEKGLLIESTGRKGAVIKLLPALVIEDALLDKALDILKEAISWHVQQTVS
ncbi:diaminobutyrate--2-oxoglutarate transaminase [Rapidithrix thailandica]|uniref:Diaminobutyrate--2-oxoglutarate transaminase n=1 Tax=Rapidithrix thailandica TaxID=413964 RepID=A0AAW9S3I9_9BACT